MRAPLVMAGLTLSACTSAPPEPTPHPYELVCESTNTATQTAIFCLRHDTRTGDVVRLDLDKLPTSNGPTAGPEEASDTYRLICQSAATDTRADLYCVRLHRRTGDVLVVNLPKTKLIPE